MANEGARDAAMPSGGSISDLIRGLKAGDEAAVQRLWERYFQRLVALASKKLHSKWRRVMDAEDAALSALKSFCERAKRGDFPDLHNRDDLWSLLAKFTAGKVADYINREKAKKRGGGKVRGDSAFAGRESSGRELGIEHQVLDRDPTPAEVAEFADQCQHLLAMLRSDELRQVALLKADGFTHRQIAAKFDTTPRTIDRWVAEIRKTWEKGKVL